MLLEAGIQPVCGAALPNGPRTADSRCQALGLMTGDALHFDHEPPLTEAERREPRAVCDPMRVQLLCPICHSTKSATERGGAKMFEPDGRRDRAPLDSSKPSNSWNL